MISAQQLGAMAPQAREAVQSDQDWLRAVAPDATAVAAAALAPPEAAMRLKLARASSAPARAHSVSKPPYWTHLRLDTTAELPPVKRSTRPCRAAP